MIVGGVVVVAAIVAAIFMASGGSDGPLGGPLGDDTPEVPAFAFDLAKPIVITTAPNPDPEAAPATTAQEKTAEKKALVAAAPAAKAAASALDAYYTAAFLDPANWQEAAYDEVFVAFSPQARKEAESQLEIMTAGSEAGFDFDRIDPLGSTLRTKVLLDPKGLPASVVGLAKFQANGTGGGGRHVFQSKGQFVLQKIDGGWTVVSFSVSRADKDRGTNPSASAPSGASPSGSAT